MLMSGSGRLAKLHYTDGTFRLISDGDHVLCAVTGAPIALEELRNHPHHLVAARLVTLAMLLQSQQALRVNRQVHPVP